MPRKGWSAYPTPSGWYNVVRGPRPQSVEWPRRQQWWPQYHSNQWPSISKAKQPIQRRWQRGHTLRGNPDEVQAAAKSRVERLERALSVLGDGDSTEVQGLQAALKEARRAARDKPVAVQIEECEAFIQRSRKRLERLEEERIKEQQSLDAAVARMVKLREEMTRTAPPATPPAPDPTQPGRIPDLVAELERLRARVKEMESEEARRKRSRSLSVPSPDLVGGPDVTLQEWGALHDEHVGRDKGTIMETLIQRGSSAGSMVASSNRFSPLG